MDKRLNINELERIIKHQEKIISTYEDVSSFYNYTKKIPFLANLFRFWAGVTKSGRRSGTKVINQVKNNNPEIIAVTNPEFTGVSSATKEMVEDVFLVSEIYSKRTASKIALKILKHNPQKVLVSGYAKGHDILISELKKQNKNLKIFVLIHSSFLWFDVYPQENATFENFLEMTEKGIIEKIGFSKKDLAEYFKELGFKSFFVMNRFYPEKHVTKKLNLKDIKVGIWGKNFWHRNITNQVVGALMVPGTEIHVNEIGNHKFLDNNRINVHGILPKEEFHKIFSKMDINLYISLTECFPMVGIESMQYGIPCLLSDTSDVYAFDKKLKQSLTVTTIDGPLGIRKKIEEVIKDYDEVQSQIVNYLPKLKKEVEESIKEFLD